MDILNVVVVFLVLEAAICGICHFVCRDRQEPGAETQPKINEWRTHGNPDAAPVSRISRTLQTDEIGRGADQSRGKQNQSCQSSTTPAHLPVASVQANGNLIGFKLLSQASPSISRRLFPRLTSHYSSGGSETESQAHPSSVK